ncbi:MAG TPA: inositol monophosphatase family protein [Streptosporangiaceae bacterium]|jgi:myo-inositol-1(or 4)-monophosphatase
MTAAEAERLLDLACEVAVAAGRLLIGSGGRPEVVATKSSPTDVVTEADQAAEALIRDLIGEKRPGDRILGEEGGETGPQGAEGGAKGEGGPSDVRWIVDPLDGTVNYLYGLPDWAVSVAAEVDGTVVAGAVFVPRRDELYSARLGHGAWLSSGALDWRGEDTGSPVRLACNRDVPLAQALVATGFGYAARRRQVQGDVLRAVLPRVRDIRRGGSAAVDLCSVASGTVDAYYERGVNLWDIAAGGLIAAEAGAQVTGLHGRPPSPSMTLAAPPPLLGDLHDLLASTDPERDA